MISRRKAWKRVFAIVACLTMATGCVSTKTNTDTKKEDTMKKEESKAVSLSFIGGKDVMPITGYIGPYQLNQSVDGYTFPNYITDEYYQMIADLGVNLIVYSTTDYAKSPEMVKKNLELGEKYGVGIFVTDSNVLDKVENEDVTAQEVAAEMINYSDYEAFCGMYLVDEPHSTYYELRDGSRLLPKYEKLAKVLHQDLNVLCYSNLFPIINMEQNKEQYERYVEEFCETLQPKVLCWDFYPFDAWREGAMSVYFWNMDIIRTKAAEHDIPFWAFIQAGAQWNDEQAYFDSVTPYYPNESQFNWNVNTCLAFGAQGIQYFPLFQPIHFAYAKTNNWDFERNGMIGVTGNKNQWYYYAQTINKQIAAVDEVLMNAVNKGIIVSGDQAVKDTEKTTCIIESGNFNELKSVVGDAMVGCFNYNGKTALYVVNYSMEYAQKITLKFDGAQNIKMIQNTKVSYMNAKNLTLDMAAGEGVLVVLE